MAAPPRTGPALIGLTGAIASGKSEALAALARLGAATLDTDAVVHDLLSGDELAGELVARWGGGVAPGGRVDRARVGAIVFESPEELRWLESTLHPRVGQRVVQWRSELPRETEVAVVEVPLLFETGMESAFDATVCVAAYERLRRGRAGERGTGLLEGRSARQLSQEEKMARATYVVRNNGTLQDLEAQLKGLWPRLASASRDAA